MDKKEILKVFTNQLNEFCEDICKVFKEDIKILFVRDAISAFSYISPIKLIQIWKIYTVDPYREQINNKDFTFFIEKDYTDDLLNFEKKDIIINKLNEIRDFVKNMDKNNIDKAMKYIENLVKLCDLYFEE